MGNSVFSPVVKADRVCHCWEDSGVVLEPGGRIDLCKSSGFVPLVMVAGSQLGELSSPSGYNGSV